MADEPSPRSPGSSQTRTREWVAVGVTVVFTLFFVWRSILNGQRVFPVILVFGLLGLIWWSWPGQQKGPHVSHQQALHQAGKNGTVIYWRPG